MPPAIPIIGAIAALASTAATIERMVSGGGGGAPRLELPPAPTPPEGPDKRQAIAQVLPKTAADLYTRTGGGISPQFLASVGAQQAGYPGEMDLALQVLQQLGLGGQ